jgi:hypothetical protein
MFITLAEMRHAQEAALSDVGFKANAAEVIGAYHPFWARLAMETIVGRSAAGTDDNVSSSATTNPETSQTICLPKTSRALDYPMKCALRRIYHMPDTSFVGQVGRVGQPCILRPA